jgi:formate dehydrogenase alpha subunit
MIKADRIVSTTCPYCGVGCNLQLHIKDETIFKVTTPFDAVVNKGTLCIKGRYGYDYVFNPDRVMTPLIRKELQKPGERKPAQDMSEWRQASWDEALDLVADRMTEIYKRDGSKAIGAYLCAKATNEDNYLAQKMIRTMFRTNNIDHCTRLCHAGSVIALQMAIGSSAMSNTAAEVIHSDVFIVTGSNTAECHPIISLQMKAAVDKYGAQLIVIDPRRVDMVNYAKLWLPLKPGTDVPVFSAMAHVILKENLHDKAFIEQRTEDFDAFAKSMEKFTPEYAESISGVDRDLIVQAARMYGNAKNGAIYWTLGHSEHVHGVQNVWSLINLAMLTGNVGREGTGLNPLRGQNNVQGASDAGAMPWNYPGYPKVEDDAAARKFEKGWNIEQGGLSRERGLTTTEIIGQAGEGGVRAIFIMGEDPMMSEPDLNHTREKMEQVEFLVSQDLFINHSGAYADVILPAVSFAEKDGTFTNTDRRVQRVRKAIEPRGHSRPDWQIICDLAKRIEKRLGVKNSPYWDYQHPSEIMDEMGSLMPEYAGVKYHRIEKVGLQTPVWDEHHPGTPFLFKDSFPSGRGKFHALDHHPCDELPDEEYPLILTTGRVLEHWHGGTLTRHSWMEDLYPEALLEINPVDAEVLRVKDQDPMRVTSRRGSIVLRAKVTEKSIPGVVFIPFFFAEAAANILTNPAMDPLAKIPEFKSCAVRVDHAREDELVKPVVPQERGRY